MPGFGGYGYKPFMVIQDQTGGRNVSVDTYITQSVGAFDAVAGNISASVYFSPDDFSCNTFKNGGKLKSRNNENLYHYEINETDSAYTVTLKDENGNDVESVTIQKSNEGLIYESFDIAVVCDYSDEENPEIIYTGIGCEFYGLNIETGEPYTGHAFAWFNNSQALEIIKDCVYIYKVKSGGKVVTRLKESDGFIITQMPHEVFEKDVVNQDHQLFQNMIPLTDDNTLNETIYAVYPRTTYTKEWSENIYHSPFAVHTAFLDYYKQAVGSDLLRRTADGKFTNAGDLATFNALDSSTLVSPDTIKFTGGYAKWRKQYTYGASEWYLDFYNSNDILLDTWHVNGTPSSPSPQNMMSSNYARYVNVSTAFLCKDGSNFYIVGNIQCLYLFDNDGNRLPGNDYETAGYAVLKKLNTQISSVLNNATETTIEYDETDVDETSEEGSLPESSNDFYDHQSNWNKGENEGENAGIRQNGSPQIDASNGELSRDEEVGKITPPNETGPNPDPTPITSGMIKAFAPTLEELQAFGSDLNSETFLDKITNYFSNPMDIVISCHTCIAPALDKGADHYLHYGLWSSRNSVPAYSMKLLTQQFYSVDMGFLNLLELRNSYKDYPPFCNYKIYLPFIGVRDIDGRICVGKQLHLIYHINVLTGDILAELEVYNLNSQKTSSYYTWQGNTLAQMPLKSSDYSNMFNGLLSTVLSTGTAIASGVSGNVMGAVSGGIGAFNNLIHTSFHPDIRMIGTVSGANAQTMYKTPYIIREYPYLAERNPLKYERLNGLPSNIGNKLIDNYSNNGQFIQFVAEDLNNIQTQKGYYATEEEKNEIANLLESGVYI